MSAETALLDAIQAIRSGDQSTARTMLLDLTTAEPHQPDSWLWLAAVTHESDEKLVHLRRAHSLAPDDRRIIAGLRALGDTVAEPMPAAPLEQPATFARPAEVEPKVVAGPMALPHFAPTGVRSRRPLPWRLIALVCLAMVLMPLAYLLA